MGHPDFRVGGKIFATLSADLQRGMVKLKPDQQEHFLRSDERVFEPASGAWGRAGATMIDLASANEDAVLTALRTAWSNMAPKSLLKKYDA